jgi:hypothetical protein
MKGREGRLELKCDGADGNGNDHDGREVRGVTIVRVVFDVAVAIVPGTRQPLGVESLTCLGGRPIRMQLGRSRVRLLRRMVED